MVPKFSWVKIFVVFTDQSQSAKILTAKTLIPGSLAFMTLARSGRGQGADNYHENINHKNPKTANLRKFPAIRYLILVLVGRIPNHES